MSWNDVQIEASAGGSIFGCRIRAGADRAEIVGPYGKRVKIAVDAPPRGGKANDRLVSYLAPLLSCSGEDVEILSGRGAPDKRLRVRGRTPEGVRAALRAAAERE